MQFFGELLKRFSGRFPNIPLRVLDYVPLIIQQSERPFGAREFLLNMNMRLKQSLGVNSAVKFSCCLVDCAHLSWMAEECHFSRCEAHLAIHSAHLLEVIFFGCKAWLIQAAITPATEV